MLNVSLKALFGGKMLVGIVKGPLGTEMSENVGLNGSRSSGGGKFTTRAPQPSERSA